MRSIAQYSQVKSSQVKFIMRFSYRLHQSFTVSIKSSKHNNNVRFLVEKYPHLIELINGITDWLINLKSKKI